MANKTNDRSSGRKSIKKTTQKKTDIFKVKKRKLVLLEVFILAAFVFLAYQIFDLKETKGEEYEMRSANQLLVSSANSEQPIIPNRGEIVDRNRKTLAYSVIIHDIFIDVRDILWLEEEDREKSISLLVKHLGLSESEIRGYLKAEYTYDEENKIIDIKPEKDTKHLVIKKGVSADVAKALFAEKPRCVYSDEITTRKYLYNNLASHVIGFTRNESIGLEKIYDKYMIGNPGRVFRTFTNEGVIESQRIEPQDGGTLITTLDLVIQQFAEEAVVEYGEKYTAENCTAIVMNPKTGEIYASAEYPSFDLNNPVSLEGITSSSLREAYKDLEESELYNKLYGLWSSYNVTKTYESGSTFKPITVAMGLEENKIDYDRTFYCPGYNMVGSTRIGCHADNGHGHINLIESLKYSCNVAMMDIVAESGRDIFYKYQHDFGYGEKTGVDVTAEESASALLHAYSNLGATELATGSMGQRFNCTPMQAITAFSAVINGGNLMQPYYVSQIMEQDGSISYEHKPTTVRKVISQETSDYLRNSLVEVLNPGGTGQKAHINGYNIGGKTGTGEQGIKNTPDYGYTYSFIGYFPVEDPQYIVLALIHKPPIELDGSVSASPMFQELTEQIINYKKIPPSDSNAEINLNAAMSDLVSVENYTNETLDKATGMLVAKGINYEIVGSRGAKVKSQWPAAGSKINQNAVVLLYLSNEETEIETVKIPNLVGLYEDQAIYKLEQLGLKVDIINPSVKENNSIVDELSETPDDIENAIESPDESIYIVTSQHPDSSIEVPKGTYIRIMLDKYQ